MKLDTTHVYADQIILAEIATDVCLTYFPIQKFKMLKFNLMLQFISIGCRNQMDVTLILDLSGSIEIGYDIIVNMAEELIFGLPTGSDRANVALISYKDTSTLHYKLDTYDTQRQLISALAFPGYGGKTNCADALRMAYREVFNGRNGDRNGVDNIVILMTDGKSNVNPQNTIHEANMLKTRDNEVYVVAVGPTPDMGEINAIATSPESEHVFAARSPREIEEAANGLLDRLCE